MNISKRKRQRGDIPEADFNDALNCIANLFGEQWLSKKNSKRNLIKELWGRFDFIASLELYVIGSSLQLKKPSSAARAA